MTMTRASTRGFMVRCCRCGRVLAIDHVVHLDVHVNTDTHSRALYHIIVYAQCPDCGNTVEIIHDTLTCNNEQLCIA